MRLLETDSASNANISSAYAAGVYTADAARHIVCRLALDQVAGNGDYVAYLTVQRAGAGSSYVMLPKTTATAASGETAIGLVSIGLPVSTGDVVTAYIDGLAGDTTTPDVACEWFEVDTLRPTTADRTLAVDSSGRATANATQIEGTDATDAITAAAEAALASTDTTVGTIAADVTTLLSRLSAARAGYLDNLSAGAVALASAVTSSALAQAIWNAVAATYNTASSMGALLNSAGAASDPLLNTVPGSYTSGTAGHALGRVGSGQITTTSTVAQSGDITEIIGGADYNNSDGLAFDWTDTSAAWPTLTSATITVQMLAPNGETYAPAGSVVTATGASKKVRLELTAAQTAAIQAKYVGVWSFVVWATLSSTRIVPLVVGQVPVKNPPGP